MTTNPLFSSARLGAIEIPNRIVMAPLTRMRAGAENTPTLLNAEYYTQRASAGLIISEGTAVSLQGQGYPNAPGIYTTCQIKAWRLVTESVHARGGRIVMQIAHNGRNSHSSLMADGARPVAPSAVPPTIPALTSDFRQVPAEVPRPLDISEIPQIVNTFRQAARNAMEAGFDGVELQGANGHLIEQFLESGTNQRADAYGGPIGNRARFLFEIVGEVVAEIGADRLGVRLSPFGQYGGIHDSDPLALFTFVIGELSKRHIAYLHLIEARGSEIGLTDTLHENAPNNAELFRSCFDGPLLTAAAYTPATAARAIEMKQADAVAFGRLFVANPDLVERIRLDKPLNTPDRATFYGGGAHGYTDYKRLGSIACQLAGVWTLAAYVDEREGHEDRYPFGMTPEGFLIYTPEGLVSAQLMKPGRAPFRSQNWNQGTPEEYQEAASGYIAYCGRYEVDEERETITHIPSVALLPNLLGGKHVRLVSLSDDKLTLRTVGQPDENGITVTNRLEWTRAGRTAFLGDQ